ncbi:MAG TPA: alpha/beta fold hydrolase [Sphingomicrobium sp.]
MTDDPSDHRQVVLHIWYPSASGGKPARYIDIDAADPLFQRSYRFMGAENLLQIRTNSSADAKPLPGHYPVIIFSHGLGMVSRLYSAFNENLASHGYVVVGVESPYFSSAFRLPNGTLVYNQSRMQAAPDAMKSQVRKDEGAIQAQDLVFTLNQLAKLERSDPILRDHMDLTKVGVFGHSRGGFAAPHACYLDPRFRACLNLDGYELTQEVTDKGLDQPYMHIQEQFPWDPPPTDEELRQAKQTREQANAEIRQMAKQWDDTFHRMRSGAWVVTVAGAQHNNFSDAAFDAPDHYKTTRADAARVLKITNAYLLAFFDRYLKGRQSALLTKAPPYRGVSLDIYRPGKPGTVHLETKPGAVTNTPRAR